MNEDRRTKKTKQILRVSLIELLDVQPLEKITVSQLVAHADIARSTFYLHYTDIFDLYDQLVTSTVAELVTNLQESYPTTQVYSELLEQLMAEIAANYAIFHTLVKSNELNFINHIKPIFIKKIMQLDPLSKDPLENKLMSILAVGGTVDVLVEWIRKGMTPDAKTVAEIISRYFEM
ncbi:TetR/AcrR family transcriptional regulator [Pediococcus siamensis]|uniref:TetR/AcrR family transcriptional regulator n=1 Tax=Pediococcus siamensis TaxID=381829 RepID=UPI0039A21FED